MPIGVKLTFANSVPATTSPPPPPVTAGPPRAATAMPAPSAPIRGGGSSRQLSPRLVPGLQRNDSQDELTGTTAAVPSSERVAVSSTLNYCTRGNKSHRAGRHAHDTADQFSRGPLMSVMFGGFAAAEAFHYALSVAHRKHVNGLQSHGEALASIGGRAHGPPPGSPTWRSTTPRNCGPCDATPPHRHSPTDRRSRR